MSAPANNSTSLTRNSGPDKLDATEASSKIFPHFVFGILAVLTAGMISISSSLFISAGIADLRAGMPLSADEAAWIPTVYNMAFLFIGPLSCYLGSMYGVRKVLLIGASIGLVAFILVPLAPNLYVLIFLLAAGGLGIGTFYPMVLVFLMREVPIPLNVLCLVIYALDVFVPLNLGFWLQGLVAERFSWRWMFWILALLLPLVIGLTVLGVKPAIPDTGEGKLRLTGFFYAACGFAFLYAALDQGERLGWFDSGTIIGLFAASALMLGAAIIRRLWQPNPFFRPEFLDRTFILLGFVLFFFKIASLVSSSFVPFYLINVVGYRPLQMGHVLSWALLPQLIVVPIVFVMILKIDLRLIIAAGVVLVGVALWMLARITPDWSNAEFFDPLILLGVGQPFILLGTISGIVFHIVGRGGLEKKWEVTTATMFFHFTRLFAGTVIASAIFKRIINVQSKVNEMYVTDRLQSGDWRTNDLIQSSAAEIAPRAGSAAETAVSTSQAVGNFLREQVIAMTASDSYYFFGKCLVVCLVLVALMRAVPLVLPPKAPADKSS